MMGCPSSIFFPFPFPFPFSSLGLFFTSVKKKFIECIVTTPSRPTVRVGLRPSDYGRRHGTVTCSFITNYSFEIYSYESRVYYNPPLLRISPTNNPSQTQPPYHLNVSTLIMIKQSRSLHWKATKAAQTVKKSLDRERLDALAQRRKKRGA
jgi:hypothetical protein